MYTKDASQQVGGTPACPATLGFTAYQDKAMSTSNSIGIYTSLGSAKFATTFNTSGAMSFLMNFQVVDVFPNGGSNGVMTVNNYFEGVLLTLDWMYE